MATITIPPFSLPLTRTETNALASTLAKKFQSQGLDANKAKTMALQIITFKQQGLTDSQIAKNFADTTNFEAEKEKERLAKVQAEQQKQQALLNQLAKEKAEREKLAKAVDNRENRTLAEIRNFNKTNTVLVANPKNPRGALIPQALAKQFQEELQKQGIKEQDQSSIAQKNNPSILDAIRKALSNEKSGIVEVVGLNRTFVQLSNGALVNRADFKGTIPQKFLDAEKITVKTPTPDNAPFGGVTTIKGVMKIVDPIKTQAPAKVKTDLSKRPSKSVFQKDKPETTPVADTLKTIQDTFTNIFTPKEETPKIENPIDEKQFDPLKDLSNFFTTLFTPKETIPESPIPETPKTTDITKPEPTTIPENKPEPTATEPTLTEKVTKFVSENGIKIVAGGIASIAILGISLAMLPKNNQILERSK